MKYSWAFALKHSFIQTRKCKYYTKIYYVCLSVQEKGFSQPCFPPKAAIASENLYCVRAALDPWR